MRRAVFGFHAFFKGMHLWYSHRPLLRLSIVPFLIDMCVLIFGFVVAVQKLPALVAHVVSPPEFWYQYFLYYIVVLLTALGLFFGVLFIAFVVGNLIAFPFNDLLAERTLQLSGALAKEPFSIKVWFRKSGKNFYSMAQKTVLFLVIAVFVAVAALVPGVGVIAAAVSVFLMAFDRLDYAFDHYHWSFKQRLSFVKSNFWEVAGFSAALGLTTAIPVINMLVMPGSVVAGASLVSKLKAKGLSSSERSHP